MTVPTSPQASVMLIDDDPADADLTRVMLRRHRESIDITHFRDCSEALSHLCEGDYRQRPDLVLLDLRMPRMNGLEFLSSLRQVPKHADLPVVVLSTSDAQSDVDECYRLQANSYIVKSPDLAEFNRSIQACTDFWLSAARLPAASYGSFDEDDDEGDIDDCLTVSKCISCQAAIPSLRLTTRRTALKWKCRCCGTAMEGELVEPASVELRRHLQPIKYFGNYGIPQAPADLFEYANTLHVEDRDDERRGAPRRALVMPVPTYLLDGDYYPTSPRLTMTTRNISSSGVCLLHTEPFEGHLAIAIDFPSGGVSEFVVETVRCLPRGQFFEVAGRFIKRL